MIPETPTLQRKVSSGEERYTNLIKNEFVKHAKEINKLGKMLEEFDVSGFQNYCTKEEVEDLIAKELENYNPTIQNPIKTSQLINDSGFIDQVEWDDILNRPNKFTPSSHTHTWGDIANKPSTYPPSEHYHPQYLDSVSWGMINNKPTFATVATSGKYTDLSNRPTNISAFTNDVGYITGVNWDDIGQKPNTFPPSTHTHSYLPLSGGTMTGSIMFTGLNERSAGIDLNNDGKNFDIGWNWTNRDGAGFYLRSTDFSATAGGGFGAYARNATNSYDLFGNPNGSLTWNGTSFTVGGGTGTITGNITGNVLTGYTKPSATSALAATDTINGAFGKLEKALDDKSATSHTHSYLPLSGGAMTGVINSNTNSNIDATSSTRVEEVVTTGRDKNNLTLGSDFYSAVNTDVFHGFRASNPNYNGGTNWADIRLHVSSDGKRYITTDYHGSLTDGTTDNSNHIPTTAFIHSKYLSLAGGTLTGHLFINGHIYKTTDIGVLSLNGGNGGENGAYLNLYGKSHASSAGAFSLAAFDGTTRKQLIGYTNGTLTWGGTAISLNGHTHSNYLPTNGNAASATKLNTARNISVGNLDFTGSANFDGTGNIVLNAAPYNAKITVGNKNNYPYHYIGTTGIITGNYIDKVITLLVTKDFIDGGAGIVRIEFRTSNGANGDLATCKVKWLMKDDKLPSDCIQVGFRNVAGDSIADIFYKSSGTYASAFARTLQNGNRTDINRAFTLVNSLEVSNTTTTDKLTSVGAYAAINDAVADLHAGKAYTSIITAVSVSAVTITPNTTNVASVGTRNYCYRSGCIVTLSVNIQIKPSLATNTVLISGLPKPPANTACCLIGDTANLRCYIDPSGNLRTDMASSATQMWYNTCVTYITTS